MLSELRVVCPAGSKAQDGECKAEADTDLNMILGCLIGAVSALCCGLFIYYLNQHPQKVMRLFRSFLSQAQYPSMALYCAQNGQGPYAHMHASMHARMTRAASLQELKLAMKILFEGVHGCMHLCPH